MIRALCVLVLALASGLTCARAAGAPEETYRGTIEATARQVARDLGLDLPKFDSISVSAPTELHPLHHLYFETEGVPDPSSVWAVDITYVQRPERLIVGGGITVFFRWPSTIPFLVWRHE